MEALEVNLVPRNASSVVTNNGGTLGEAALAWKRAYISAGYWDVGDIKAHHSYNGAAPVGQGWFKCDGSVINEANYNTLHGAGSWAIYVGSSVLDGKYSPDLMSKYLTFAATTTQTGSSAITSVGSSGNTVNLAHGHSHAHTVDAHRHQWLNSNGTNNNDQTYDTAGDPIVLPTVSKTTAFTITYMTPPVVTGAATVNTFGDSYTSSQLASTSTSTDATTSLSTTQTIRPESIETIPYIRII